MYTYKKFFHNRKEVMLFVLHVTAIQLHNKFFDESFVIDIKATSGNNQAEIYEYEWANMQNVSQNPARKMLLHIQYKQKTLRCIFPDF